MKHTPVIALTAQGADENKQRCMVTQINAVLTKPLTEAQAANILNPLFRLKTTGNKTVMT